MALLFSGLSSLIKKQRPTNTTKPGYVSHGGNGRNIDKPNLNKKVTNFGSSTHSSSAKIVEPEIGINVEQSYPTNNAYGYGGGTGGTVGTGDTVGTGGTGGGYYTPQDYSIDLSDILSSYTQASEAQKQTIKDTTAASIKALQDSEASQRSTLSKALERFQQDTAEERKLRQSNFNANRADLEAQAYMANRQAMQSAAARGIGGSGLQQLAQLQNLINQSAETSNLAQLNTDSLNALAESLARREEDTTTSLKDLASNLATQIQNLNTAQANQLNEIDANTASLQNQLKYQEAVRAQDARTQAEQFAASLAAQNANTASNWELYNLEKQQADTEASNLLNQNLSVALEEAEKAMKEAGKKKNMTGRVDATNEAYNNAIAELNALRLENVIPENIVNMYKNQLSSMLNSYTSQYDKFKVSDVWNTSGKDIWNAYKNKKY